MVLTDMALKRRSPFVNHNCLIMDAWGQFRATFLTESSAMSIAIIAYGSLIWDEDNLAPHISGGWRERAGPRLPVEFSRISVKRSGALVLTIDEQAGHRVATHVTRSTRDELPAAARDLARRERSPLSAIGMVRKGLPPVNCRPAIGRIVHDWLLAQGEFDAAIWVNLPANFERRTGRRFDPAAGLAWLRRLSGEQLREAWRYITFAPPASDTPFRRYLRADPWWRSLNFA